MKNKFMFMSLLMLFFTSHIHARDVFSILYHDGQTFETCSGSFSYGVIGLPDSNYGPNENLSITFCSDSMTDPYIRVHFDAFQLGENDSLYVYDGSDTGAQLIIAATGQDLKGQSVSATGGCLHFNFVSSDFDANDPDELTDRIGWQASISCFSICDFFVAEIEAHDGLMHCPETVDVLSFSATATYLDESFTFNPDNFEYTWQILDDTFTGPTIDYPFGELDEKPGAYAVRIHVYDNRTGCETTAYKVVMIGTYPTFDGTNISTDTVCSNESFTLTGVANPTMWTAFDIGVTEDEPVFINRNNPYASSLDFDVFEDAVISEVNDINRVCVTIEHAEYRDVAIFLRSPNGVLIELKTLGGAEGPEVDFINLGEPVLEIDDIPGTGYEYCFAPEAWYGTMFDTSPQIHEYQDNAGNYYAFAYFMPIDGTYTPDQNFSDLTGSPLNGTWEFMIEHDQDKQTSGHVFGWRLMFDDKFYPDSLIFIPEIVEERWFKNGNALNGNPATTSVEQPGDHEFLFQATDNFGCTYDTLLTVHVLPLPEIEIISELEIPVCEGDSTLLTIHPINNDGLHYLYQWQAGGIDIPESTYDTLMVKEPGNYTVFVTDTITGCFALFDFDVSEQNCDLTIPNVFTPNGDGINDEFEILNLEHYPNAQIVIFNRYGKRVFEHHDYYNNWWDGGNAPDGTYFYVLQYARMGKMRYAEGSITIIR